MDHINIPHLFPHCFFNILPTEGKYLGDHRSYVLKMVEPAFLNVEWSTATFSNPAISTRNKFLWCYGLEIFGLVFLSKYYYHTKIVIVITCHFRLMISYFVFSLLPGQSVF